MIYLSGPMTGLPDHNFPAFCEACRALRAAGYEIVSPHEDTPELGLGWTYYLRRDLLLLLRCDAIALLPGWAESKGATLELSVASALEFRIYNVVGGGLVPL